MAKEWVKKANLKGPKGDLGDWKRGELSEGFDIFELWGAGNVGLWSCNLASTTSTILNLPQDLYDNPVPFTVTVKTLNNGVVLQLNTAGVDGDAEYVCNSSPTTGNGFTSWKKYLFHGDVPDYTPAAPTSGYKTAALALTAPADASATIAATGKTLRLPVQYGVPLGRVRLHGANRNDRGDTTYPGAVSFTGVWFGPGNTTTGVHAAAPVKVANGFTTPADGSEWVTPWFEANTAAGAGHLLSISFTAPAGTVAVQSIGTAWSGVGSPSSTAAPGALTTSIPFDFWLEVEAPASTPIIAELGSSGAAGSGSTRPMFDSALSIYARRVGALPLHYAHSGSTLAIWDEADHQKWQKWQDYARPDALLLSLGSNDVYGSATLDETKAKTAEVLAIAARLATPNLYATTIPPRDTSTAEATRRAYNTWLLTKPLGIRDVIDWNGTLSADDETTRPEFYGDGTHTNTAGAQAKADAITARLVPVPVTEGEQGEPGPPGAGVPAGGSSLQLIRKNSAGTTTEWVTPSRALVGLSNVDNTADEDKPISTATQTALDGKAAAADVAAKLDKTEAASTYATNASVTTEIQARVDPAVASAIANDPSVVNSAANMAQNTAGLVPAWKASTSYTAGQRVIAPSGDIVSAKVNFTSTATYSATNWNASTQDGRVGTLETNQWLKANMPGTADFDTYTAPGAYSVSTSGGKTNIPALFSGNLQVYTAGAATIQEYRTGEATPRTFVRRLSGGVWGTWRAGSWVASTVTTGTDFNAITTPGAYPIQSASHPNQPFAAVGTLEVLPASGSPIQRYTTYENPPREAMRRANGVDAWTVTSVTPATTKLVGMALNLSGGTDVNTTMTDYGGRMLLDYGVTIPKWRVHLRNYNLNQNVAFPGAINLVGLTVGEAEQINGFPTGRLVAPTATQVASAATTPADGSEWVSGWITTPLLSHKKYMLSYGFTAAEGQVLHRGQGAVWTLPGSANVHDPYTYGSRSTLPPLDIWIEAEVPAHVIVKGVIGDSLSVALNSTSPVHDSFLSAHCRAVGALPVHWAASGDTLSLFADTTAPKATRYDGMARPDVLLFALGSNDIFGSGVDFATMQTRFHATMNTIRDHATTNIVLCSIWPRLDAASGQEDVRQSYNEWLETTLPGGASMYLDIADAITAADGRTLDPRWIANPGNIHLSTVGYARAGAALTGHVKA